TALTSVAQTTTNREACTAKALNQPLRGGEAYHIGYLAGGIRQQLREGLKVKLAHVPASSDASRQQSALASAYAPGRHSATLPASPRPACAPRYHPDNSTGGQPPPAWPQFCPAWLYGPSPRGDGDHGKTAQSPECAYTAPLFPARRGNSHAPSVCRSGGPAHRDRSHHPSRGMICLCE